MTAKTTIVFRSETGWNVRFTGNQAQLMREMTGSDAAPLPLTPAATLAQVEAYVRGVNPGRVVVLEHA